MRPVSPVIPGKPECDYLLAKDQPEFIPLPVVILTTPGTPMVSRWEFTDEERRKIADGADLVFTQFTCGHDYQATHFQLCARSEDPNGDHLL